MLNLMLGIILGAIAGLFSVGLFSGAKILRLEYKVQKNEHLAKIGQATEKALSNGFDMYKPMPRGNDFPVLVKEMKLEIETIEDLLSWAESEAK